MKARYYHELLTTETMKLLGSTKSKITKSKSGENVPHLEITEVVLIHCNVVNNSYQQSSRVLYTFVPNKSFGYQLNISPENVIFLIGNTKGVKIAVPLKYLSNFWRTLEISLLNCEINLILTWCEDCVISSANGDIKFKITDTKLYVPVVILSTQDNAKLLQQLKSGFKRKIDWNRYQTKVSVEAVNQYFDFLIDPSFQGVNRLFLLLFENEGGTKAHTRYYLPEAEITL